MKCTFMEAVKRAIKKSRNPKKYSSNVFNDEFVDVPENNLKYGELKLVFDKKRVQKQKAEDYEVKRRKMDKDKFIKNIITWGNELEMTDEEYNTYMKSKSLSERMEQRNIHVLNK